LKIIRRAFSLTELLIVIALVSALLGSSGFYFYRALRHQYFKESIDVVAGKIKAAEEVAYATQGVVRLIFEKEKTVTLRAEGAAIQSNVLRSLFGEKRELREVAAVTGDTNALPLTIEVDPDGKWYRENNRLDTLTITPQTASIEPWTHSFEKKQNKQLYEKYPKQVFEEHQ